MPETIEGEYYLEGLREMASGFLFRPDGSFQFFFTYGAMDRFGSGKWVQNDGQLVLNSRTKPPYDFALVDSKLQSHDFINIKMDSANPSLLRHVFCSLQNGVEGTWKQMSQYGDVQFPKQPVETISLILEFCPERFSIIPINQQEHNEFTFRFETTIMEVFFQNFSLQVKPDGLSGNHPLMEGDVFSYAKQ
jgi:hypothetical protein